MKRDREREGVRSHVGKTFLIRRRFGDGKTRVLVCHHHEQVFSEGRRDLPFLFRAAQQNTDTEERGTKTKNKQTRQKK